jgi:CheY-like chemotaxis protein
MADIRRAAPNLSGLRMLVVEDETILSFMMEEMLAELGCTEVWHAASVRDALAMLDRRRPDAAVLDVNLGGEYAFPIADRLAGAGVPFIFATGYGRMAHLEKWAVPVIQKPFAVETLAEALGQVIGAKAS